MRMLVEVNGNLSEERKDGFPLTCTACKGLKMVSINHKHHGLVENGCAAPFVMFFSWEIKLCLFVLFRNIKDSTRLKVASFLKCHLWTDSSFLCCSVDMMDTLLRLGQFPLLLRGHDGHSLLCGHDGHSFKTWAVSSVAPWTWWTLLRHGQFPLLLCGHDGHSFKTWAVSSVAPWTWWTLF